MKESERKGNFCWSVGLSKLVHNEQKTLKRTKRPGMGEKNRQHRRALPDEWFCPNQRISRFTFLNLGPRPSTPLLTMHLLPTMPDWLPPVPTRREPCRISCVWEFFLLKWLVCLVLINLPLDMGGEFSRSCFQGPGTKPGSRKTASEPHVQAVPLLTLWSSRNWTQLTTWPTFFGWAWGPSY